MGKHTADVFFTVVLFLLFALVGLIIAVMGANVYRNTADNMTVNYDTRTSVFYISEKIRQSQGEVTIGNSGNLEGLVLHETSQGKAYETWIFCGNGKLREVTVAQGGVVKSGDGQAIMEIEDLKLNIEGDLLTIDVRAKEGRSIGTKILLEGVMP